MATSIVIIMSTEAVLSIFLTIIWLFSVRRYLKNKNRILRFFMLALLCGALSPTFSFLAHLIRINGGWLVAGKYIQLMAFMNAFSILSGIFFLGFCLEVFYHGAWHKNNKILMIVYSIAVFGVIIYTFWTGFLIDSLPTENTYTEFLNPLAKGLVGALYMPVHIILFVAAYKLQKRVDSLYEKTMLRIFAIGPVAFFINVTLHTINGIVPGTPFNIPNMFVSMLSISCLYLGYMRPPWFQKFVKKRLPVTSAESPEEIAD